MQIQASPAPERDPAPPDGTDPHLAEQGDLARRGGTVLVVAVLAAAVTVALAVLGVTGALGARSIFDPGPSVRYGLPALRTVHDLAAALTVGLLFTAAFLVPPAVDTRRDRLSGARRATAKAAVGAALAWLASGLAVLVLTTADVAGVSPGTPGFGGVLASFVTQVELGRAVTASLLGVAMVVVLAVLATKVVTIAWAATLSVLALLPLALAGHSAGSQDHMNAVDSLALHLVSVCLWTGGLAALVLMARRLGPSLPAVAARYSTVAGWCFVVVALSGVINAGLRLNAFDQLISTPYGRLVLGKTVALVLLGVAGWLHRRATLRRISKGGRWFARLAVVELLVMGATMGLAVALSRSAPPVPETGGDPVAALLGYPMPPPVTPLRYVTEFHPETLWLAVAAAMLGLYLAGVVKLRGRGDRWPVMRTLFWTAGCLALVFDTSGGPGVYGRVQFSLHMLQHMSLMVVVPLLLVFGAPVTLAMRALAARTDGSFGPRELLLSLVHARALKVLGHPIVAAAIFTGSLVVFYYSPLFELAISTHIGHLLMTAHFVLSGYLFIWALVGIDPGPARPPYPLRLVLLMLTLAFHAFFGISLMGSAGLLAGDWWRSLGMTNEAALLEDQQTGGAIAWAAGDIPSVLLGVALVVSWVRSDAQETRRKDRQADRDDDAELRRYNERLSAIAQRRSDG